MEEAGNEILGRIPQCGKHQYVEEELKKDIQPMENAVQFPTGSEQMEDREQREILSAVFRIVVGYEVQAGELTMQTVVEKFRQLTIELNGEEKLLLKLCFQDGLDITAAGRLLSLNRFQAHGRMKRLLARLRKEFNRVGLSADLRLLLQN